VSGASVCARGCPSWSQDLAKRSLPRCSCMPLSFVHLPCSKCDATWRRDAINKQHSRQSSPLRHLCRSIVPHKSYVTLSQLKFILRSLQFSWTVFFLVPLPPASPLRWIQRCYEVTGRGVAWSSGRDDSSLAPAPGP